MASEKKIKIELSPDELNLFWGGLGWYKEALQKRMKKESAAKKRELSKVCDQLDKLSEFCSRTLR